MESADKRRFTQMVSYGVETADDTDSADNVWKPRMGRGLARMATEKESQSCVAARPIRRFPALRLLSAYICVHLRMQKSRAR
jgi:hypothetical protein